jgi:hypothetical protein
MQGILFLKFHNIICFCLQNTGFVLIRRMNLMQISCYQQTLYTTPNLNSNSNYTFTDDGSMGVETCLTHQCSSNFI